MDLIVKKNNGDEFVYSNTSMIGVKPESNVMVLVRNNNQYTLHLDEIEEYYFEDRKPRVLYIVVDQKKIDRYGLNVKNDKVSITTPFLTHDIVFDGRTEPEPVRVSKEVMEDLKEYVDKFETFNYLYDFSIYPKSVQTWLREDRADRAERVKLLIDYIEGNRTLITTEQYVIRSIDPDENDDYSYLRLGVQETSVPNVEVAQFELQDATHFETREEASEFLIAGMEVVEV